jgi:DNA-binding MarR family transcriptional regulator
MDTTYSGAEAARRLGTSIPRVVRCVERLGLDCRTPKGRLRISPKMLDRIEGELGRTPRAKDLTLTPPQAQVLAALARSPRGLASARAVADVAGVAPTTASRALKELEQRGFVRREETTIAAGRPRRIDLYHANRMAEEWRALAPCLMEVQPKSRGEARDEIVPRRLHHLFWNTAPSQLVVADGGHYIARRLLTSHDLNGLSWGARNLAPSDWRSAANARGLDERTRALALQLAEQRGDEPG